MFPISRKRYMWPLAVYIFILSKKYRLNIFRCNSFWNRWEQNMKNGDNKAVRVRKNSQPLKKIEHCFISNLILVTSTPADVFIFRIAFVFLHISLQYLLPQQQNLTERDTDWKSKCHVTRLLKELCVRCVTVCLQEESERVIEGKIINVTASHRIRRICAYS